MILAGDDRRRTFHVAAARCDWDLLPTVIGAQLDRNDEAAEAISGIA